VVPVISVFNKPPGDSPACSSTSVKDNRDGGNPENIRAAQMAPAAHLLPTVAMGRREQCWPNSPDAQKSTLLCEMSSLLVYKLRPA
jgi:hypothetical protein